MSDFLLLKSQMNDVFLLIKAAGLNPTEFAWKEEEQERENEYGPSTTVQLHRLVHKPSGYSLLFGELFLSYTPGSETKGDYVGRVNWAGKQEAVGKWLTYLKREIDTPDLWGSLADERGLLDFGSSTGDNSPFSEAEQIQIKLAVEAVRSYITKTQTLSEANLQNVNARLDYLIDASKQLGRIHWKDIFVSTLLAIAWQLALPAPDFHDLFSFAGRVLRLPCSTK
jgi:hypothetical protein